MIRSPHRVGSLFAVVPLWILFLTLSAPAAEKKSPEWPVKAILAEPTLTLEKQIAALALQRPVTPPNQIPALELRIDLRILQRWCLAQCIAAPTESDLQADAYLRARHLGDILVLLEPASPLATTDPTHPATAVPPPLLNLPNPAQSQAALKLHQLTFTLADATDSAKLDNLCFTLAQSLAVITGLPADRKDIPLMRPAPISQTNAPGDHAGRSLAQLRQIVRASAVAIEVRQQLLALADQAAALAADPRQRKNYSALYQVLANAVDLAQGLANNTAVTQETRRDIETQLAQALALYADPRTRAAGQERFDALRQYRNLVSRYGKLELPPQTKARLAPVFAYAQENPRAGSKLLAAIDRYADLTARYDALKPPAANDANRRFIDDLRKQFDGHRSQFLDDAAQLTPGGMLSASPDDLLAGIDEMQHELELLEALNQMPASLDTLGAYKPRPHGGLERRITLAAVAATATTKSPARADAANLLKQTVALAAAADALHRRPVANVPADIAQNYAANTLDAFDTKWNAMVTDAASQLAAGTADSAVIQRLDLARQMLDALNRAILLEQQLHDADVLARWADWAIAPQQLREVFIPWRDALANAFDGFVHDRPDSMDQWAQRNRRDQPLFNLLSEASQYADACRQLPTGLPGAIARLATPLNNQTFAAERFATLGLQLLIAAPVDDAESTARQVLRHLANTLRSPPAPSKP
jgi:hypothetical protein